MVPLDIDSIATASWTSPSSEPGAGVVVTVTVAVGAATDEPPPSAEQPDKTRAVSAAPAVTLER